MNTWRLKSADRAALLTALAAAGWTDGDDITPPAGYRLDELGELPATEPVGDPDSPDFQPGTMQAGWFVNILDIDDAGLPGTMQAMEVTPSGTPFREFAI